MKVLQRILQYFSTPPLPATTISVLCFWLFVVLNFKTRLQENVYYNNQIMTCHATCNILTNNTYLTSGSW